MADPIATTPDASPSTGPSRWKLVLARIRQWLAVAVLLFGAWDVGSAQLRMYASRWDALRADPAPLFYLAGGVGLALGMFWARYLAICFATAILAIDVFSARSSVSWLAAGLGFIALLSGRTMEGLFEGRTGRLNRWAAGVDHRVARLRLLFVAQSVVIGLIWAAASRLSPGARPLAVAATLTLGGLVLQRTWAALLLAPIIGLEACLAAQTVGVRIHFGAPPPWTFTATLFVACAVSLAVISPMLAAFARKLRGAG